MAANILEKLAGNKTIANLAFGQIRKFIKEENISMICLFVDNNGDIAAKQYEKPVVVISQEDYTILQNKANQLDATLKISHE